MKTITANKTEQRDWVVSQKDVVPTRKKEGRCKSCKKKLSIYNTDEYCFLSKCQSVRQKEEDILHQEHIRERIRYYKKQNKKYYERKKNENTGTDSKGTKRNSKNVLS